MPRSDGWLRPSSPSRASRSRWARSSFIEQIETGVEAAYQLAGETMACNMIDDAAQEGAQAFMEKRKPRWAP